MNSILKRRGSVDIPLSADRFYLLILLVVTALFAVRMSFFALGLHRNFSTIAIDTAVLQSGIVNTLQGHWFCNNGAGGPNILGSHTTFVLLLVAPLYAIFPSLDLLFVLQVCGVYSTVIPLYLVGCELLRRPWLAFLVAIAALLSPFLLHLAMAPLHFETLIPAAVLWSYLCYLRNQMAGFLAGLLFACCCAEQATLIYMTLGISWLLIDDGMAWRRRFGWFSLGAGFAWVLLAVVVIEPLARGSRTFNIFAYNYAQWKIQSVSGLPMAVAQNPWQAVHLLTDYHRWLFFLFTIGLPLFFTVFSLRSIVLLAPLPFYFLMSDQEFYLYFHAYYFTFGFLAAYLGLLFLLSRSQFSTRLRGALMAGTLLFCVLWFYFGVAFYVDLGLIRDEPLNQKLHQVFGTIPREATVYAPHRYSAYLSNRENLVIGDLYAPKLDFNKMMEAQFPETNVRPEQVDYIVCDYLTDQCGWRQHVDKPSIPGLRADNVARLLQSSQWQVFWNQNAVIILKRVGK